MFTINDIFDEQNVNDAFEHFEKKRNTCGPDNMYISEFPEYWKLNKDRIISEIMENSYNPSLMQEQTLLSKNGKERRIIVMNVRERFICRLISQKLNETLDCFFQNSSYAYRSNIGTSDAVEKIIDYIRKGCSVLCEIDIRKFFDNIPLDIVVNRLDNLIDDSTVKNLINKYLYASVKTNETIYKNTSGLIQGCSLSPVLSNLYMNPADVFLSSRELNYIRFADNMYVMCKTVEEASYVFTKIKKYLSEELHLELNPEKSGIYNIYDRLILGYRIQKNKSGQIECRKHKYEKTNIHAEWHPSAIRKNNNEYYIIQNGVLNKNDYDLLFENNEEKHHIPVNTMNHLTIYNEVSVSSSVLNTLAQNNIMTSFVDKNGNLIGNFIPRSFNVDSNVLIIQCLNYADTARRLSIAKSFEISAFHNMRAIIRYYIKKGKSALNNIDTILSDSVSCAETSENINELMLIEARAKQAYYSAFDLIITQPGFEFGQRTRQPPQNALNSMISFGNTLLYNFFSNTITKSFLNTQIGVVHASNRRECSLNLDFADIFKPLIIDRTIFSLINLHQMNLKNDFYKTDNNGIYLSDSGKRKFINEYQEKLNNEITVEGKKITWKNLMENEVFEYQRSIVSDTKYKPYKYY